MLEFLLVFIGGGLGSITRYGVTKLTGHLVPGALFPWHTLAVNILGALAIGALLEVLALRTALTASSHFFLITGFLGGFTTFSAFSLECALMFEKGDYTHALAYIAVSVIGAIGAVFIGGSLARTLV
jgi:CrcB protein